MAITMPEGASAPAKLIADHLSLSKFDSGVGTGIVLTIKPDPGSRSVFRNRENLPWSYAVMTTTNGRFLAGFVPHEGPFASDQEIHDALQEVRANNAKSCIVEYVHPLDCLDGDPRWSLLRHPVFMTFETMISPDDPVRKAPGGEPSDAVLAELIDALKLTWATEIERILDQLDQFERQAALQFTSSALFFWSVFVKAAEDNQNGANVRDFMRKYPALGVKILECPSLAKRFGIECGSIPLDTGEHRLGTSVNAILRLSAIDVKSQFITPASIKMIIATSRRVPIDWLSPDTANAIIMALCDHLVREMRLPKYPYLRTSTIFAGCKGNWRQFAAKLLTASGIPTNSDAVPLIDDDKYLHLTNVAKQIVALAKNLNDHVLTKIANASDDLEVRSKLQSLEDFNPALAYYLLVKGSNLPALMRRATAYGKLRKPDRPETPEEMLKRWRPVLPRRFRGNSVEQFAATMKADIHEFIKFPLVQDRLKYGLDRKPISEIWDMIETSGKNDNAETNRDAV